MTGFVLSAARVRMSLSRWNKKSKCAGGQHRASVPAAWIKVF